MNHEQFVKLLRKSQEGKHTILCEMDNAFADHLDKGLVVTVYAFPGTQEEAPEGMQVAIYLPFAGKVTYVPLTLLRPIKKTKAMPSCMQQICEMREHAVQYTRLMNDCFEKLSIANPVLSMGLRGLLQGIENLNSMDDDIYNKSQKFLDICIQTIGKHEFLIQLSETLGNYKSYTDRRDQNLSHMQEVSEAMKCFEEKSSNVLNLSEEKMESICSAAKKTFQEKMGLSESQVHDVVHVRVLLSAMFMASREREFFTYDELLAAVRKYRPEIARLGEEALNAGIKNSIEKAQQGVGTVVPAGLIEKNVMDQYCMTDLGRGFGYFTIKNS